MNTFRKIVFSVMLMTFALACHAYDVEVDGIYYDLNKNDNTASVTYWSDSENNSDVVIPEYITVDNIEYTVTSIGYSAFRQYLPLAPVGELELRGYGIYKIKAWSRSCHSFHVLRPSHCPDCRNEQRRKPHV
ncbi:MAG: hypothetical protein ACI4V5_08240 [Prevotella sp.]